MNKKLKPTQAREFALKFLYHLQLSEYKTQKEILERGEELDINLEEELNLFYQSYTENDEEHPDNQLTEQTVFFAKSLIIKFLKYYKDLLDIVKNTATGWKIENINKIDLTILLLAICEMNYTDETPRKVVINEAINMAKKYGKEESFSFVNGVLDAISKKGE